MTQTLSNEGLAFLASHEGIVPAPYRDSVGVLTWGVGHTAAAGHPDPASLPMAMPQDVDAAVRKVLIAFREDVKKYEAGVRRAITVPMAQHEFDAAVSFHFNTGSIGKASWVNKLNAGDKAGAIRAIMNWTKPPEIKPRRQAERDLFAYGKYGSGKATVWGTNGRGGIIWKPVRVLSQPQLLNLMQLPHRPDVEPADPAKPQTGLAAFFTALAKAIQNWRRT